MVVRQPHKVWVFWGPVNVAVDKKCAAYSYDCTIRCTMLQIREMVVRGLQGVSERTAPLLHF